jgi:DnaJ like chaperone protein
VIRYEKWLGAGIGWLTGGPVGGMIGYAAGRSLETDKAKYSRTSHTSEFESNLIVIAASVIKADGKATPDEISFTREFFKVNFTPEYVEEKMAILDHCLHKSYDLRKACDGIRITSSRSTRTQVVNFLFDLALSDGELSKKETDHIFVLAGWLNVNDIEYRKIKASFDDTVYRSHYELLGVRANAPYDEVKASYRKLVLEYHPDRNNSLSAAAQKTLADKFRKIREAFEKIKAERGVE